MSDKRHLIVVDVETSGLDPDQHIPIEVAAINVDTNETILFAPEFTDEMLAKASREALRINRYFERGVYKAALNKQATADAYQRLFEMLKGDTLGGSNPRFDAQMLLVGHYHVNGYGLPEQWHHRLPDVASYVAGAYGIYAADLRGLAECCEMLGVTNECEHSALADAKAALECFRKAAVHTKSYTSERWGAK